MKPVFVILVCVVVAVIAWMLWPPSTSQETGVDSAQDEETETSGGPMLEGRAPPPGVGEVPELDHPVLVITEVSGPPTAGAEIEELAAEVCVTDIDGNPIEDVTIELAWVKENPAATKARPWQTDPTGCAILQIRGRHIGLIIKPPEEWWHSAKPRAFDMQAKKLSLRLHAAVTFDGVVLDPSGLAVPSTFVGVEWFGDDGQKQRLATPIVSDGEGRFRLVLPRMAAGFALWAAPPQSAWDRIPQHQIATLNVSANEVRELQLRFALGETIEGYVVDEHGEPVRAGSVSVQPFHSVQHERRSVALDGKSNRFRFTGLDSGPHWVRFDGQSSADAVYSYQQTPSPAFDVRIEPTVLASLSGRVVGDAVEGLEVTWYRRLTGSKWFNFESTAKTKPDGSFELNRIGSGDTRLLVREPAGSRYAFLENLTLPQTGVEISLSEGSMIRGTFEKPTGAYRKVDNVGATQDGIAVWGTMLEDGTFTIGPLPPGRWTLYWLAQGQTGKFDERGEVEAGDLDVVLQHPSGH